MPFGTLATKMRFCLLRIMEAITEPIEEESDWQGARRLVSLEGFEAPLTLAEPFLGDYARRWSVLLIDDARSRQGGIGSILCARNTMGERCAIKVLKLPEQPCEAAGVTDDAEGSAIPEYLQAAFDREYEAMRLLSGLRGFPELMGRGSLEGKPAIVMEWVEGDTLQRARRHLAVDAQGRLAPLTAAALGRDLFDLLGRMELLNQGLVHRDISLANVMVRTGDASLEEQARAGEFDLMLVDFGSAAPPPPVPSLTQSHGLPRGATPDFAAPEMLADSLPDGPALRRSAAVDVYAAASVIYALYAGRAPFGLESGEAEASYYQRKVSQRPAVPQGAHQGEGDIRVVLQRQRALGIDLQQALSQAGLEPSDEELRRALAQVDDQLTQALLACLATDQALRPAAMEMRDALQGFIDGYEGNLVRALKGEALASSNQGLQARRPDSQRKAASRLALAVKGVMAAILLATAIAAGVLVDGCDAGISLGAMAWQGPVNGWAAGLLLLCPAAAGFAARWRDIHGKAGFLRGVAAAVAVGILLLVADCLASWTPSSLLWLLAWAIAVAVAAPCCMLALDRAAASQEARAGTAGRRAKERPSQEGRG